MKEILISGSSGFIGKKLINALEKEKSKIRVISRKQHPELETIRCNFLNDPIPPDAFKGIKIVFHIAGAAHDTYKRDEDFLKINYHTSIKLAELAANSGVKKFIYLSTVKSTGLRLDGKCLSEEDQLEPEDIYGKSKRKAEIGLLDIGNRTGMDITILRPSLVYGPGVKGNLDKMIRSVKSRWFPPLPNVSNRRSMIHVDDVVRAILFVNLSNQTKGQIYNLTDGKEYSSREIFETICYLSGRTIPNWSVPDYILRFFGFFSRRIKLNLDKLLGDECYSSKKLFLIGFKTNRTLKDMNETIF